MDSHDNNLDFREVDRRYAELVRKRDEGTITEEEFDTERQRLMVRDEEGFWWAKSRQTGEWKYYDSGAWVEGTPPGYEPSQTPVEEPASEDLTETEQPGASSGEEEPEESAGAEEEPEEEAGADEQPRRRLGALSLRTMLLLTLALLVLLGVAAYTVASGTRGEILVPELVGVSSVEKAQGEAEGDFRVVKGQVVESREPAGTIVEQDPPAGVLAEEGSTVRVSVSKGPAAPATESQPPTVQSPEPNVVDDAGDAGDGAPPPPPAGSNAADQY
jgi:hypothetical protein